MKAHSSENRSSVRRSVVEPLAVAAVIITLVISGVIALRNFRELQENRLKVRHTNNVLASLRETVAAVMDAESGQRGFLITGNQAYLDRFDASVRRAYLALEAFTSLTVDNREQQTESAELRELIDSRIEELRHVLQVHEEGGVEAAKEAVATDSGKRTMDRIHEKAEAMRAIENGLLVMRELTASRSYRSGRTTSILSTAIGLVLVVGVLYLLERNRRKAEQAALELRIIRERLQLALDAAEMGSWNINPATKHMICDEQFRKIFGFEVGEATYQRAVQVLHPEDRDPVEAAIAASTRPDNPAPYDIEYRVVRPDGSVRWVLAKGAPHFTGTGKQRRLTSFDGTVADITDRKRQQQRLLESEQAAHAANQSKSEFLANMSHEIRTPMAAILGYADVLLGHLQDPDNRNCILVMKRNGQHLLALINDILDLSRIEAGKVDIDLGTVSLVRLVSDVQSLMQVRADEKNLDFRVEFTSRVPEKIETDATRLRQVLINLIGNAIKFTEEGSVVLSVRLADGDTLPADQHDEQVTAPKRLRSASNARVQFTVRDTGIGMSVEQQERLFKPFSQGDSSVTRSYGGSGLGLAISKRLAGILGGEIEMESELGAGSTFTVTIPFGLIDESELIQPDLITPQNNVDTVHTTGRRLSCCVLVVDDRRDVRHISQHFLEKAGATVVTAEDGQQAIDIAIAARDSGKPFELIVMDMQMPNVDGLQATGTLRSAGVEWPIIALTADAMKGDRDRCLDGGCDDYLSKPIDHAKLVGMVARYTQDVAIDDLRQRRLARTTGLYSNLQPARSPKPDASPE